MFKNTNNTLCIKGYFNYKNQKKFEFKIKNDTLAISISLDRIKFLKLMAQIITLANFKGGVGKTTSAINIGAGLASMGKKVLLIDLDPQSNLTQSLGVVPKEGTIYDFLVKKQEIKITTIKECLDIIPSSLELISAEVELSSLFKREELLSTIIIDKIEQDYDYEYIILDCPPTLGLLTINSFTASDFIFIPIEAEYLALRGYVILKEAIEKYEVNIDKIFVTKYDRRKNLNREVYEALKENFSDKMFNTLIRDNVALAEAPTEGEDIYTFNPKCNGAIDYLSLTKEIVEYCDAEQAKLENNITTK